MKKILIILMSSLFLLNCKNDDDSSGDTANPNVMTYLDETHDLAFVQIYYFENSLNVQGATADENYGFAISFMDKLFEDLNGNYTHNPDSNTYNSEIHFNAATIYYLGDAMFVQSGQVNIQMDFTNEEIILDFEFTVMGEPVTGHYEGSFQTLI